MSKPEAHVCSSQDVAHTSYLLCS